jgi:hypothetical protein
MAGGGDTGAAMNAAALARRQALAGPSGPAGLLENMKVFGIAMFACLGGYVNSINCAVSAVPVCDAEQWLTFTF